MIRQRLDAPMQEHSPGVDPAPPRQRIEVILRLDDFVCVEQDIDLV